MTLCACPSCSKAVRNSSSGRCDCGRGISVVKNGDLGYQITFSKEGVVLSKPTVSIKGK